MDALARAVELAEQEDLHVLCATLRGEVPQALRARLLHEAATEGRAVLDANGWAVWWVEEDADGSLMAFNALAQDAKQALVALEDEHPLGAWFNLDLVTRMPDGRMAVWHGSPMRPGARRRASSIELADAVAGYDWS